MVNSEYSVGIDIVKIGAMFMVVVLHILGSGGVLESCEAGTISYNLVWLLECICMCAVNLFALTTGYLLVDREIKKKNILMLWFQVAFYSVAISFVCMIVFSGCLGRWGWIWSFFPVSQRQYWYFSTYFAMYMFLPYVNKLIVSFDKREYTSLIITIVLLFTVLPLLSLGIDAFDLNYGYSPFWLLALYFIGGYIKKYHISEKIKGYLAVGGYLLAVILAWSCKIFIGSWSRNILGEERFSDLLIKYTSPTMLIASVCLLLLCLNKHINIGKGQRLIRKLAKYSFAVYLIHYHPVVVENALKNRFSYITELPFYLIPVLVIGLAIAIFFVCIIIEHIRTFIFKGLRVNNLADYIMCYWGKLTQRFKVR